MSSRWVDEFLVVQNANRWTGNAVDVWQAEGQRAHNASRNLPKTSTHDGRKTSGGSGLGAGPLSYFRGPGLLASSVKEWTEVVAESTAVHLR